MTSFASAQSTALPSTARPVHRTWIRAALAGLIGLTLSLPAQAELQVLGQDKNWTAYRDDVDGQRLCYIVSDPTKSDLSRRGRRRGEVHFIVSHWPDAPTPVMGQPSVVMGYPLAAGGSPVIQIGSDKIEMVLDLEAGERDPNRERAWIKDAGEEERLINAMRRGSSMIVRGRSTKGTESTDRYSLLGFTAAMKRINGACKPE